MDCSKIDDSCRFTICLNTPSIKKEEIVIPLNNLYTGSYPFQYQIELNVKKHNLSQTNFGAYFEPVFIRPLELSIYDGNLLNKDASSFTHPISTGFEELKNTQISNNIVDLDEQFYEKLIMSDILNPFDLEYFGKSITLLQSPSITDCAYEINQICLLCVNGFELDLSTNTCNFCTESVNLFTNKCENSSTNVDFASEVFHSYVQVTSPGTASQEVGGFCNFEITDFYSEFLDSCELDMSSLSWDGFISYKVSIKLDDRIISNQLTLPTEFTLIMHNVHTLDIEISRKFIYQIDSNDEISLSLQTNYTSDWNTFFFVHLPNYRTAIPTTGKPIVSIKIHTKTFSISSIKSSKVDKEIYSINDLCPDNWFTYIINFSSIQCFETVPPHLRLVHLSNENYLRPCGSNCSSCNNSECISCSPGYFKEASGFDCLPGLPSCFEVENKFDECTNAPNYYDALVKAVFFYDFQRAGYIPPDERRVCWRYHTFLMDQGENAEVLIGGWFDSKGTMKLNLQLSFTIQTLCLGIIYFKNEYENARIKNEIIQIIKPAVQYLLSAYVDDDNIYSHCGDINIDSQFWGRPEDYNGARQCYKVPNDKHPTDLYSSMSSAFSAASMVFKDSDLSFSEKLKSKAESLFLLAMNSPKDSLKNVFPELSLNYDYSEGIYDELFEAGLMLDKTNQDITNRDANLHYYSTYNFDTISGKSWNNRRLSINFLLFESTGDSYYLQVIENYIQSWIKAEKSSEFGLPQKSKLSNLHQFTMTMFHALILNKIFGNHVFYEDWVRDSMHFILGKNIEEKSLIVGYSSNFMENIRHKASSCPSPPATCNSLDETKLANNPNHVIGAIVNGIEEPGFISDSRSNFSNGIRLISNAPISGILVRLFELYGNHANVNTNLFPDPQDCSDAASDYPSTFTLNLDLYILYKDGLEPSPFPSSNSGLVSDSPSDPNQGSSNIDNSTCTYPCLECTTDTCIKCDHKYFLSNNQCESCPSNCISCVNESSCSQCIATFTLNENKTCIQCPANCINCSSSNVCNICKEGYVKDLESHICISRKNESIIKKPSESVQLPSTTYTSDQTILEAEVFLNNISNCKIVKKNECLFCHFGYFWNGQTCTKCIANCLVCSNHMDCMYCKENYTLTNKSNRFECKIKQVS